MHHLRPSLVCAALLVGAAQPALAHVDYFDLGQGLFIDGTGASYSDDFFSSYGWFEGTLSTLGDSHDLAGGRFYKFHLDIASKVTITFLDTDGFGVLNPAFSLYAGLLPDDAHDDTLVDPLNPKKLEFSPAPHVVKLDSPVDNDVTADAHGNISPKRKTAEVEYDGQFDALHDWSMANSAGEWSVIRYVTHVAPTGGNAVSLVNYLLQAGDYTVAAAGGWDPDALSVSNLAGRVTFTAAPAPVPLPGMGVLFGGALVATLARRRRA